MNVFRLVLHLLFWSFGFLLLFRIPFLKKGITGADRSVSIIIPARNEGKRIPELLESLKKQSLAPEEILVVDDNSSDNTSLIALEYGATAINPGDVPRGWLGKPWACYQGARAASGKILVFLDADTVLENDAILKLLGACNQDNTVVSVQPFHIVKRFYEQLSAIFNIVLVASMGSFTILGNKIRPLGLFGPCVVTSREDYFEVGGHGSAKADVLENVAVAQAYKKKDFHLRSYGGRGTISFRMYPGGIGEMIEGWSKGFASGAVRTSPIILIMVVLWITGAVGTVRSLVELLLESDREIILWALLYFFYVFQINWMLNRIGSFWFITALFHPIPLLFFVLVFFYSVFITFFRRTVTWKGRKLKVGGDKPR